MLSLSVYHSVGDRRRSLRSNSNLDLAGGSSSAGIATPSLTLRCRIMGRKAGGLFINAKKFGTLHKPCMKEMIMFLNCMTSSHNNSEAIARQKELLSACMESQSKKNRKSWGSINYQLQRLSRGRK